MKCYASIRYVTLDDTHQVIDFKSLLRMIRMKPPRTCRHTHTANATRPTHTSLAYTCLKRIKRYISNINNLQPFKRNNKRNKWPLMRNIGEVLA